LTFYDKFPKHEEMKLSMMPNKVHPDFAQSLIKEHFPMRYGQQKNAKLSLGKRKLIHGLQSVLGGGTVNDITKIIPVHINK
jgi:hypothetical protein